MRQRWITNSCRFVASQNGFVKSPSVVPCKPPGMGTGFVYSVVIFLILPFAHVLAVTARFFLKRVLGPEDQGGHTGHRAASTIHQTEIVALHLPHACLAHDLAGGLHDVTESARITGLAA